MADDIKKQLETLGLSVKEDDAAKKVGGDCRVGCSELLEVTRELSRTIYPMAIFNCFSRWAKKAACWGLAPSMPPRSKLTPARNSCALATWCRARLWCAS